MYHWLHVEHICTTGSKCHIYIYITHICFQKDHHHRVRRTIASREWTYNIPAHRSRYWVFLGQVHRSGASRCRLFQLIVWTRSFLCLDSCYCSGLRCFFAIFTCGYCAALIVIQFLFLAFSRHPRRRGAGSVSSPQHIMSLTGCDTIRVAIVQVDFTQTFEHGFTLSPIRRHGVVCDSSHRVSFGETQTRLFFQSTTLIGHQIGLTQLLLKVWS